MDFCRHHLATMVKFGIVSFLIGERCWTSVEMGFYHRCKGQMGSCFFLETGDDGVVVLPGHRRTLLLPAEVIADAADASGFADQQVIQSNGVSALRVDRVVAAYHDHRRLD
ncbi:hypothetical protein ACLOJK_012871 [Asimina triloba]